VDKFSLSHWEMLHHFVPPRIVVTSQKDPINVLVHISRDGGSDMDLTSQMFTFLRMPDPAKSRVAILRDIRDFRVKEYAPQDDMRLLYFTWAEVLVRTGESADGSAKVKVIGQDEEVLSPQDYEITEVGSGLRVLKRTSPLQIKNLRTALQAAIGIADKSEPKFLYEGDAVITPLSLANKSQRKVIQLHLEKLSLAEANLVTNEGKGRSPADFESLFKTWNLLPAGTLELNPKGVKDLSMKAVLDSLFLPLSLAQPFGRQDSKFDAFRFRVATQAQMTEYNALREECISDLLNNSLQQMATATLQRAAGVLRSAKASVLKETEELVAICSVLSAHRFPYHYGKFLACRRRVREGVLVQHVDFLDPTKFVVISF
jgi:hypothetical protein